MSNKEYIPPYTLTSRSIHLVSEISELVGIITIKNNLELNPKLRRENRIRTIYASLAIENNSLSLDNVTEIINGKRVLGNLNEIREVKNAYEAYNHLLEYNPYSIEDMLEAHKILMLELTRESGKFRTGSVGIYAGTKVVHIAPPANLVPNLVFDLTSWAKNSDVHPLIKSCIFHYELEFIHPFADGNGRIGRMWQTLLLYQWKDLFAWLPIETIIKDRQAEYYNVLAMADQAENSSVFIEFLLTAILDTLIELSSTAQETVQETVQVKRLLEILIDGELSTREMIGKLGLKHRQTFLQNYLHPAISQNLVEMTIPDKPNSRNQKYRLVKI